MGSLASFQYYPWSSVPVADNIAVLSLSSGQLVCRGNSGNGYQ